MSTHEQEPVSPEQAEARTPSDAALQNACAVHEMLEMAGEMGPAFADAYRAALDVDPMLADVRIISDNRQTGSLTLNARFMMKEHDDGNMERFVFLDATVSRAELERHMRDRPNLASYWAERLDATQLSPDLYAQLIFLHELGHAQDSLDDTSEAERTDRRKQELEGLGPVHGVIPSELEKAFANPDSEIIRLYRDAKDKLALMGFASRQDILNAQSANYRQLPSEQYADNFAIWVIDSNLTSIAERVVEDPSPDGPVLG